MTIFTPYQDTKADPQYGNLSRGIDVGRTSSTLGTALGGIGDVFSLGVRAVDDINKNAIDKELRSGISNEIQDSINAGQSLLTGSDATPTIEAGAGVTPGTPVPSGVQAADRRMGALAQANRMGKLDDVNFYANIQTISQGVVSKYPGYEGYIHERTAHWLQTDPGRAVRSSILSSLSQLMGQANRDEEKWVNDVEKWFAILGEEGTRRALSTKDPEARNQIRAFVAGQMHSKYTQDRVKDDLQLELTRNNVNQERSESAINQVLSHQFTDLMTRMTFTAGGFRMTGEQIQSRLAQIRSSGERPEAEIAAMGMMLGNLQQEWDARVDAIVNGRDIIGADGKPMNFRFTDAQGRPQTFSSLLRNTSKINEAKQMHSVLLANMIRNVGAGRLELATSQAEIIKSARENATIKALQVPYVQALAGIDGALGGSASAVVNTMMTLDSWKGLVSNSAQLLQIYGINTSAGGAASSRTREISGGITGLNQGASLIRQAFPGREPTPAENRAIINTARFGVNQRDDETIARNWAEHIAQGGTTDFFSSLTPVRQFDAWAQISSRATGERIQELAKTDPGLWQRYDRFVATTFQRLFASYIDDVNRAAQFNQRLNIEFNPSTGRIDYSDPRRNVRGPDGRSTGIGFEPIDRLNVGLAILREHMKLNGEEFSESTLKRYGIDLKQKYETPWLNNLMDAFQRSLQGAGEQPRIFDRNRLGGEDNTIPPTAIPNQGPPLEGNPSDIVREGFDALERPTVPMVTPTTPRNMTKPERTGITPKIIRAPGRQSSLDSEVISDETPMGVDAGTQLAMSRLTNPGDPTNPMFSRHNRPSDMGGGVNPIESAAIKTADGKILTGPSHYDIIHRNPNIKLDKAIDGFVTNEGKFVSREEALRMVNSVNAIRRDSRSNRLGSLLSEDLPGGEMAVLKPRRKVRERKLRGD